MVFVSSDLPQEISVELFANLSEGNLLNGLISGELPVGEYIVSGDIIVDTDESLTLLPGTKLLFGGPFYFLVNGTLIAEGTEQDSIIFDSFNEGPNHWGGITFENASDESILDYISISGVNKSVTIFENENCIGNNIACRGAALSLISSSIAIKNATISNNVGGESVTWRRPDGIYIKNSSPMMENILLTGNTSNQSSNDTRCAMYINNETYSVPSAISITNLIIKNNEGYGLYFQGSRGVPDNVIMNNITIENNGSAGIWLTDLDININNISIKNNGFYGLLASGANCRDTTPDCEEYYCVTCSLNIENATITNNANMGVSIQSIEDVSIISANINGNQQEGLFLDATSAAYLNNVRIIGNNGTGILLNGTYHDYGSRSPVILENVFISGNSSMYYGGGIYSRRNSEIKLDNVIISNNHVTSTWGGGLFITDYSGSGNNRPSIIIKNSAIINNLTDYNGAAIYLKNAHASLINVTVAGNTTTNGYNSDPSYAQIVFDNIEFYGATLNIINSIISHGDAPLMTPPYVPELAEFFNIDYSIINCSTCADWVTGGGTVFYDQYISSDYVNDQYPFYVVVDPLFVDPDNGDYTLQINSPAIDMGTTDIDNDGTIDITEYSGLGPDLGAFEYGTVPGCSDENACNYTPEATMDIFCAYEYDCLGICGGGTFIDQCGNCGGNNTSCADCAGTPNGSAYIDNCGVCDADSTNDCEQDCEGYWGGSASLDVCDICSGSNIQLVECIDGSCGLDQEICETNICEDCFNGNSQCCDLYWYTEGYTCNHLIENWGWDCSTCNCLGDNFICGDNVCDLSENNNNCPADCDFPCGDLVCESNEDIDNCPYDCAFDDFIICGDGVCVAGEYDCEYDCTDCYASWIADGYCDPINNNAQCNWDGGDCCPCTSEDSTFSCSGYGGDCDDCLIDGDPAFTCSDECSDFEPPEESNCDLCENDYTNMGSECCDTAWEEYGYNCFYLENVVGWDCSGCACSGDSGELSFVVFSGGFGGAVFDGNTYTNPTGAEPWAGFANEDTDLYPFSFADGGEITFTGATAGTDADVYFRFEYNPYPDTEPSFNTASVTVSGTAEASYSVEIPAQDAANTYSSFILYVTTLDAPVTLTNIAVAGNSYDGGNGELDFCSDDYCDAPNDCCGACGGSVDSDCDGERFTFTNTNIKNIPLSVKYASNNNHSDAKKVRHIKEIQTPLVKDGNRNGCGYVGPDIGCDGQCFTESWEDVCGEACGDGSTCAQQGDMNGDGLINVLDVVALVENILSAVEYNPAGDLIEDAVLNVLDIVALVNIILGGG